MLDPPVKKIDALLGLDAIHIANTQEISRSWGESITVCKARVSPDYLATEYAFVTCNKCLELTKDYRERSRYL